MKEDIFKETVVFDPIDDLTASEALQIVSFVLSEIFIAEGGKKIEWNPDKPALVEFVRIMGELGITIDSDRFHETIPTHLTRHFRIIDRYGGSRRPGTRKRFAPR